MARVGLILQAAHARRVNQPHVFHRMARLLAAITARWRRRVLGTLEAPFGPLMATRGAVGSKKGPAVGGADGGTRGGTTTDAPRGAAPTPARTGWGPPPACTGSPGGPPGGHEATDGLCAGPSRTAAPAPLGGGTSSGRRGSRAVEPRAWAMDRSHWSSTAGRYAAVHRGAMQLYALGTRLQQVHPTPNTPRP
jgi:hypothetical protein